MSTKRQGTAARLGVFDRFLTLWIFIAMAAGVAIGTTFPGFAGMLDSMSVGTTNVPIAVGLVCMMYSPLAKVDYSKMPAVFADKRLLALSLLLNWVVCPLLMFALAMVFLNDLPAYMNGIVMIGLARCIAMVLVWNELAGGSNDYAAGLVAVSALFQVLLYGPMAWLFLQVLAPAFGAAGASVDVSAWQVAQSVLVYLGIPLVAGALTRMLCVRARGAEWFEAAVVPRISNVIRARGGLIAVAEGRVVYITEVPQSNEVKLFEHEPDIMTKQQLADLLGVTTKTVSRESQRGRLECFHAWPIRPQKREGEDPDRLRQNSPLR